jgi:hypothetical protein
MSRPALSRELNKFTVYIFGGAPAFLPVQDELGADGLDKRWVHVGACQYFLRILTWHPVIIKTHRLFDAKGRVLLLASPSGEDMMPKA